MKYAFYPGCALHSTALDYNESTQSVANALGIELIEVPDWTCCGASPAHFVDNILATALPIKNTLRAKEIGDELLICCAACFSRFKFANKRVMEDPETEARIKEILKIQEIPHLKISHFLDVLINKIGLDTIKGKMKQELNGLRVAAYYGCLLVRPPKIMEFDDPEDPTTMDRLIKELGGEPVSWAYKVECCGGSLSLARTDIVLRLTHDILQDAHDAGAECLVVACPLCQNNLDMRQDAVNKKYNKDFHLPIFYFTQLLGLALGIDKEKLGLQRALVNGESLLENKGISLGEKKKRVLKTG